MTTPCPPSPLSFHPVGRREVVGRFEAGRLTSEAGGILLRDVDQRLGLMPRLAACFRDCRHPDRIDPLLTEWIAHRVHGLALGYDDLHDHDPLRADSRLALMAGKTDLSGAPRRRARDRGRPLASSKTLNRLELGTPETAAHDRSPKIVADPAALDRWLVALLLEAHASPPEELWLDVDATDDPLHGEQEGRFFHGYDRPSCD